MDTVAVAVGRHNLRFGLDYQRLTPVREQPITSVVGGSLDSVGDVIGGIPPRLTFAQAGAGASLIETLSLFAQNTWRVTPRLNVTYGVRWELTPPPSYRTQPITALISTSPLPPNAASNAVPETPYLEVAILAMGSPDWYRVSFQRGARASDGCRLVFTT